MKSTPRSARAVLYVLFVLAVFASVPALAQVCGNGIVEPPEECDDGAAFRLDGCAPDCTYEHVQRMTALALGDGAGPSSCTPATNAFGSAFSSLGLTALNTQLATVISTPDRVHHGPAMRGLELGYDILLEKPISTSWRKAKPSAMPPSTSVTSIKSVSPNRR